MKKLVFLLSTLFLILIFVSGCGPSAIVVRERPAVPYYVRPAPTRPGYIWIDGDWIGRGNGYVYRQGYWAAPRRARHYVPGHWQQRRQGWVWVRSH
jgi:hypothetical protein